MTLEQLRIFVAVAEREHVTQAARDLNLTQSATSAAIAALESRYAIQLFDRIGRRIVLSSAGRLFLAEARAVLARAEAAELVLSDLAGLKIGSLSLAASQTVGNYWLPPLVTRFRTAFPGLSVTLSLGNTETVAGWVKAGEANIGLVEGEVDDPALVTSVIAEDEMSLIVSPGHRWAGADATTLDFRTDDWVMRERGSGTRAILETVLREHGVEKATAALVLPSNEAVLNAVAAGHGAAVLSKLVVGPSVAAGRVVEIAYAFPRRTFSMVQHRERFVTSAEKEFIRLVADTEPAP